MHLKVILCIAACMKFVCGGTRPRYDVEAITTNNLPPQEYLTNNNRYHIQPEQEYLLNDNHIPQQQVFLANYPKVAVPPPPPIYYTSGTEPNYDRPVTPVLRRRTKPQAQRAELLQDQRAELLKAQRAELLKAQRAELLQVQRTELLKAQRAELLQAQRAELLQSQHAEVLEVPPGRKAVVDEPISPPTPAQYDYGYSVSDPHTGDSKTQQESRRGDVVTGSYSVIDADGTRRIVEYTADPRNGFTAMVRKESPPSGDKALPQPIQSSSSLHHPETRESVNDNTSARGEIPLIYAFPAGPKIVGASRRPQGRRYSNSKIITEERFGASQNLDDEREKIPVSFLPSYFAPNLRRQPAQFAVRDEPQPVPVMVKLPPEEYPVANNFVQLIPNPYYNSAPIAGNHGTELSHSQLSSNNGAISSSPVTNRHARRKPVSYINREIAY